MKDWGRLVTFLVAGAVIVLVIVLHLTGVIGGKLHGG
jgi:hypothetical protein